MKKLPWSHPNYKPDIDENEEEIIKNEDGKSKKQKDFYSYFKDAVGDQIKYQALTKD